MREAQGGCSGKEIPLDGNDSEKEENGEGRPGTDSDPVGCEKKDPKSNKDQEENPALRQKKKVEMTEIDTGGEDDEDGNERKAKGAAHLCIDGLLLSGVFEQFLGDHPPLYLVGLSKNLDDLGIPHHPFHRIVLHISVASEDLDGIGGHFHGGLRSEVF